MINALNSQTPATGGDASARRQQELRQAAQAFEAVFIRQLIGSMRNAKRPRPMSKARRTRAGRLFLPCTTMAGSRAARWTALPSRSFFRTSKMG